ncbi:MAG: hypothetical protein ACTSYK_03905 [Alphaproteobacteria bacterium]
MNVTWVQLGGAACASVLALMMSAPAVAADQSGLTAVAAEELDKRSKQPQKKGLTDTRVRIMLTYAFSLIPAETTGKDGKTVPVDKSDFNTFVIPNDEARVVIRAATRSAYADACGLPELGMANLKALMTQESKKDWTGEQMLMIEALHHFSMAYFTGNAQILEEGSAPATGDSTSTGESAQPRVVQAPQAPKCPPEQKAKVENAIRAYVASVGAN